MASRDLKDLLPGTRTKVEKWLLLVYERTNVKIKITCTYRSTTEQYALYAQGRNPLPVVNSMRAGANLPPIKPEENKIVTKLRHGKHQERRAVDFVVLDANGKCRWDAEKADVDENSEPDYYEVGALAAECDLEWGGNWKTFKDFPHLQDNEEYES